MYAKQFITVTNTLLTSYRVYKNYIEKYLLLILKLDKKMSFYFKLTYSFYTLAKIFGVQNQKKRCRKGRDATEKTISICENNSRM